MSDHVRCHYVSPDGVECSIWIEKKFGDLCHIHKEMVSGTLAANGVNKPEYINIRKEEELSLRARLTGKTNQEACVILDTHIAGIEKIIEQQKMLHATAKAIRSEVIDSMTAEEIQVRRRMVVTSPDKPKKVGKLTSNMTDDEKVANLRAKHPTMTEKGARSMLGLD